MFEHRKYYYWLVARRETDGQRFLIYGGETEEEAQQKGLEMLGGNFEIKRLPTRDQGRASNYLKGHILEKTRDLGIATKRLKHKIRRENHYDDNTGGY